MKHFLIIEKQPVVVAGITVFLSAEYPLLEITSLLPEEVFTNLTTQRYEACIMDVSLIRSDINEMISYILKLQKDAKIILFSNEINTIYAKHYLKIGAKGFISKFSTKVIFKEAVRTVLENKVYLCDEIKYALSQRIQ